MYPAMGECITIQANFYFCFMPTYNLVAISGSLRKGSYNSALMRAFKERAPEGVNIEILDISTLPLFNQDVEVDFPLEATALKEKIKAADGVIISTPEYNRSVPGVLKNAIDWMSRPHGDNAFKRKPVYVVGASQGPIATALAQADMKKIMMYLDAFVLGQPEFYLGTAQSKFDENGTLTDETTQKLLDAGLGVFTSFIDTVN
jgi:chromate reductase